MTVTMTACCISVYDAVYLTLWKN